MDYSRPAEQLRLQRWFGKCLIEQDVAMENTGAGFSPIVIDNSAEFICDSRKRRKPRHRFGDSDTQTSRPRLGSILESTLACRRQHHGTVSLDQVGTAIVKGTEGEVAEYSLEPPHKHPRTSLIN